MRFSPATGRVKITQAKAYATKNAVMPILREEMNTLNSPVHVMRNAARLPTRGVQCADAASVFEASASSSAAWKSA